MRGDRFGESVREWDGIGRVQCTGRRSRKSIRRTLSTLSRTAEEGLHSRNENSRLKYMGNKPQDTDEVVQVQYKQTGIIDVEWNSGGEVEAVWIGQDGRAW